MQANIAGAALTYIRAAIRREHDANWARLRRIPSTYTWRVIDYVASLDAAARERLFESFASNGLHLLDPARDASLHRGRSGDPDYAAFRDGVLRLSGPAYYDARMLRMILADVRSSRPSPELADTPPEVLRRAETITPVKVTDIRKALKPRLAERFGAKAQKESGGVWHYVGGRSAGREFRLWTDFGGMSDQLRYEISYDEERTGIHARRLTYEGLLGFGFGHWDFVTAENLEESLALLCEFIEELVALPERLPSGGC